MILPGYGAPNATCCLPWPWLVNTVMNRLSPVSRRLPAPSSASSTPADRCWLPSPKIVSMAMPCVMYIIDAGFGDRAFARIELDLDELHLVAVDLEVDVVRAAAGRRRRRNAPRRRRRRRGPPTNAANAGTSLTFCQLRHAGGEHERLGVDAAVLQVGDDLLLADRSDLMAADGHVPLRAIRPSLSPCRLPTPVASPRRSALQSEPPSTIGIARAVVGSLRVDLRRRVGFERRDRRRHRARADARAARGRCARRPTRVSSARTMVNAST